MIRKNICTTIILCCQAAVFLLFLGSTTQASKLDTRSITLSNSQASATDVTYVVQFRTDPNGGWYDIGGIVVEFCAESPIVTDTNCTTPAGFDLNLANLVVVNQINITNFTINANSDSNTLIITKAIPDHIGPNAPIHFELGSSGINDGVVNPSASNQTFYAKAYTFNSETAAENYMLNPPGSFIDAGGFALSTASGMNLQTIVPPFLRFCSAQSIQGYDCSTGTALYVNFGDLGATFTATGMSQMVVATNANNGYGVSVHGTTLTSGNNIISAMATPGASVIGVGQFGINLVTNFNPAVGADPVGPGLAMPTIDYGIPNNFKYVTGDTIITGGVTDWRKFTASYIVNVPPAQSIGLYSTTLTYICLANF